MATAAQLKYIKKLNSEVSAAGGTPLAEARMGQLAGLDHHAVQGVLGFLQRQLLATDAQIEVIKSLRDLTPEQEAKLRATPRHVLAGKIKEEISQHKERAYAAKRAQTEKNAAEAEARIKAASTESNVIRFRPRTTTEELIPEVPDGLFDDILADLSLEA